jgi:hypothetical protein
LSSYNQPSDNSPKNGFSFFAAPKQFAPSDAQLKKPQKPSIAMRASKNLKNPYNKTTHMLAKYAEYANIGGNKTAAYGQTKFEKGWY